MRNRASGFCAACLLVQPQHFLPRDNPTPWQREWSKQVRYAATTVRRTWISVARRPREAGACNATSWTPTEACIDQCDDAASMLAPDDDDAGSFWKGRRGQGASHPSISCEEAIEAAAHANGISARLMAAVGLVETGRRNPVTGTWHPWPWTINAKGRGFFFGSKAEAILSVRALQTAGVHSIDVGCMQVNLMHHPDAFAALDEAFDPQRNASYAGRFLNRLFRCNGNWMTVAGRCHSTTADLAAEYTKQLAAHLPDGKLRARGTSAASTSMIVKDIAPRVGPDGMIVPSTRLTRLGFIASRS